MAKNERRTENVVREELRRFGYYDPASDIQVEEQKTNIALLRRGFRVASKSGRGGAGSPEFIISSPSTPDFVILVECKASTKDHSSGVDEATIASGDAIIEAPGAKVRRIQRYAVDGILHYSALVAKDINVIAIAVSGETLASSRVSVFLHSKGAVSPKALVTDKGASISGFLPWDEFIRHASFDETVQRLRFEELMSFSRELHDFMRDHAKLTESEKPLLVSGTLLALRNSAFAKSFDEYKPDELQKEWIRVITTEIEKAKIPQAKKDNLSQPYSSISVHPELGKPTKAYPKGVLNELITQLNEKVWPFLGIYNDYDVVGQFYGEFLKYTGGDKKALGIVLTPRHVTELFSLLAHVGKDDVVLDICAGTGGFLISAMHQMMRATNTQDERDLIKAQGLVGCEQQPNMFALAASNMILRGDGKANLYQGSCFDAAIADALKKHDANVGMLNPPFSQSDEDLHELYFTKHMLDCLRPDGVGIAVVPMSCAIAPHAARYEILKYHTLEAVMSLPDELFYPVGTVVCIMVFRAHRPHEQQNTKTWFGYWKNDGFVKTKKRGRVDLAGQWSAIRDHWVDTFRNREVHVGESVMKRVTAADEWCAEAYMETDYSNLGPETYKNTVKQYLIFQLMNDILPLPEADEEELA
ncbi:SAM-dependent DNA methyltransferase [Rhizobium sp. RMa-01]|uniref:HsdM family class I SAM-dependent methyltransferase n=1 Tax=unclassified Rhizobium TaxID=2613769 RepID=UPI0008D92020|nr:MULTISPECIES: N-6 DNA methylase [unclassified Rhizobium]OHV23475.1 restriction endonuclease [Rhizobium sp. RSm-3]RVU13476.1 SAM-dependent DNA methyltransferase [Rhizobium sp. RMa-01]